MSKLNDLIRKALFAFIFTVFFVGLFRTAYLFVFKKLDKEPPATELVFMGDETLIEAVKQRYSSSGTSGESDVTWDYFWKQGCLMTDDLSMTAGIYEKYLNLPPVEADSSQNKYSDKSYIYDMGDGYLVNIDRYCDESLLADRISKFDTQLKSEGIPYIFVAAPGKISVEDEKSIPFYYDNHSNSNSDELITYLKNSDVDVLDLRPYFSAKDDYRSYFYRNDHHWNNKATLYAAGIIAGNIYEHFGLKLDQKLYDVTSFKEHYYKDRFYGTLTKDTSLFSSGALSDLVIYEPDYPTEIKTINRQEACTLTEAFCDWDGAEDYNSKEYMAYCSFGIKSSYEEIENLKADNELCVLVLSDSYSYSLSPYLSLAFKKVISINVRDNHGGAAQAVREQHPDIVIQLTSQDNLNLNGNNTILWDYD